MVLSLLVHTVSTSTVVDGDCCIYWQNAPKLASSTQKTKLIDATPLSLDAVWEAASHYDNIKLLGIDLLLPLKLVSVYQVLSFIRGLADEKNVTVIVNSDDSLRSDQGDHELLLKTLSHASDSITALRALPSGRDKEFAGMVRFTRGHTCQLSGSREGERLYKYGENMMSAIL